MSRQHLPQQCKTKTSFQVSRSFPLSAPACRACCVPDDTKYSLHALLGAVRRGAAPALDSSRELVLRHAMRHPALDRTRNLINFTYVKVRIEDLE